MPPTASYLVSLFQEFPFQEGRLTDLLRTYGSPENVPPDRWPRSFRVQLACMVTMVATALLPKGTNRLGFAYNANAPRSGKTLAAQTAVCPVYGWTSGRPWPVGGQKMNQTDETELRKALDAVALEGSPYIFFDNIRCQVESQALEGFMTMPVWTGRVMGTQRTFSAPIATTIILTGNDLKLSVDMMERFLFVDFYVEEVEAQSREIQNVIEQPWIIRHKEQIFTAVMGLITHWDAMGRPPPPNRVRRGFETFGNIIGGIIAAAGFGDLFEKRPDSETYGNSADTDIRVLATHLILERLATAYDRNGTELLLTPRPALELTFDQIVQMCFQHGIFSYYLEGKEVGDAESGTRLQLSQTSNAKFGALLKRYAPEKKTRSWELPHNSRIALQAIGSGRSRKYIATLQLTPRGRIHQLMHHDEIGHVSLDQYLESQGLPLLSRSEDPDLHHLISLWHQVRLALKT